MEEKKGVHEKSSSENKLDELRITNKIMGIIGIVFSIVFSPVLGFILGVIPLYLNTDKRKLWKSLLGIIIVSILALGGMTMLMLPTNYSSTIVLIASLVMFVLAAIMIIVVYVGTSKNKDVANISITAIIISVVIAVLSSVLSKYISGIQLPQA